MVKRNASSEKVCQFMVDTVMAPSVEASASPSAPPSRARHSDSVRNARRMAGRWKPSARRVPISAVRWATEAYIVVMAPMTAPSEKVTERAVPRTLRNFTMTSDCSA